MGNFNESALFHYAGHDEAGQLLGGLIRVANRPNEGYAECTILVWLPDGSALFNFERPSIEGNERWYASGWKIDVIEPGGVLFRTRFEGSVLNLRNPRLMAEPKAAFKEPRVQLNFDLRHAGKAPLTEFKHHRALDTPEERERYGTSGLQQLTKCFGSLEIDRERRYQIQGFGWRDHNWGPRNWQGMTNHTFLTGNFGEEEGFSLYSTIDGHGYYFHRGRDLIIEVATLAIETECAQGTAEPERIRATIELANGERHEIVGRQKGYMPLRNRREGMVTTLGYSLWEYVLDGNHHGIGLGEFLSQSWATDGAQYYKERRDA